MSIDLRCKSCGKRYRLKDSAAGRSFACKDFDTQLKVPQPAMVEAEDIWEDDSFEEDSWEEPVREPSRRRQSSPSRRKGQKKKVSGFPTAKIAIGGAIVGGVLLLIVIGIGVIGALGGGKWEEFRPPGAGFRISFPGRPKPMPRQARLPQLKGHIYETRRYAYFVAWMPIPPQIGGPVTAKQRLDAGRDGALANVPGSRLTGENPVQLGSHEGREIRIEADGKKIVLRMFIVRNRLYMLQAIHTGSLSRENIDRFFDSFVLNSGETTGKQTAESPAKKAGNESFLEQRKKFKTHLTRRGPVPQEFDRETPPTGVKEVRYRSGSLNLKAWVSTPRAQPGKKFPALVFFHGGFAFGAGDLAECKPFMDAGFVVMAPMLRGENGNPGHFELFNGELDDARAAVKWIASQPNIDRDRIYTFGHSVGGGTSAMLSLFDDVPIQHGGSSGGLYDETVFEGWADIVPFDRTKPQERKLRVLLGHIKDMKHEHMAYLGTEDNFQSSAAQARREGRTKLKIQLIPGDHFTSFQPSLRRYLAKIQRESR